MERSLRGFSFVSRAYGRSPFTVSSKRCCLFDREFIEQLTITVRFLILIGKLRIDNRIVEEKLKVMNFKESRFERNRFVL
jgi:hypothetical protein